MSTPHPPNPIGNPPLIGLYIQSGVIIKLE